MQKDSPERYATAAAMATDLADFGATPTSTTTVTPVRTLTRIVVPPVRMAKTESEVGFEPSTVGANDEAMREGPRTIDWRKIPRRSTSMDDDVLGFVGVEVRDVECADGGHCTPQRRFGRTAPARVPQFTLHPSQRAKHPCAVESLPLTVFAECHPATSGPAWLNAAGWAPRVERINRITLARRSLGARPCRPSPRNGLRPT
jgi:hypothetical protein